MAVFILTACLSVFLLAVATLYYYEYEGSWKALVYEPTLSAKAWAFFDPSTGEVITGVRIEDPLPIASITKLFTAYAALNSEHLDRETSISWSDLNTEGRAGKLSYGEQYTVRELLFPLLVESSNDAGAAIERVLNGTFAEKRDGPVTVLGLTDTTLVDSSGLSPYNVSSARDLARFYSYLKQDEPHLIDITTLPMYIGRYTGWINTSPMHTYSGYRGGKEGYLPEAGHTFVGSFAVGDEEIGVVLLGSSDLERDFKETMQSLGAN